MTQERALYIKSKEDKWGRLPFAFTHEFVKSGSPLRDDGITFTEDEFIRMIWSLMGDTTSYHDALDAIAAGL